MLGEGWLVDGLRPQDPPLLGSYQLLGRLGSGGMGVVFLGCSPGGRPVAIKMIRPELAATMTSDMARPTRATLGPRESIGDCGEPEIRRCRLRHMPYLDWLRTKGLAHPGEHSFHACPEECPWLSRSSHLAICSSMTVVMASGLPGSSPWWLRRNSALRSSADCAARRIVAVPVPRPIVAGLPRYRRSEIVYYFWVYDDNRLFS